MQSLKKLILGLVTFSFVAVGFLLLGNHHAAADEVYFEPSKACVPKYKPAGNADHHTVDGWLTVSVQDRAHLKVTYNPQGNCASPAGSNDQVFFGTSSFSDIFQNLSGVSNALLLYDNHGDNNVSYNEPFGSTGSGTIPVINGFDGTLDDKMRDAVNGYDKVINIGDLRNSLNTTQIHLGLDQKITGYGCSDDNATNGGNFDLTEGNPPHWRCDDGQPSRDVQGLYLGPSAFTNLQNFNITYTVGNDGAGNPTLVPVYDNEKGDKTMTWCSSVAQPDHKGRQGMFIGEQCTGKYGIEATLDQIKTLGGGVGTYTFINLKDKSQSFDVRVAGADTSQSNSAGGGSPTATSDSSNGTELCTGSWELSYLTCPLLNLAQGLADYLEGIFEGQLSFTLSRSIDGPGQASIYKSWSIFRDIASSILVIVMLMMVISQAMGTEAYAVKKMLPRLIIATILLQISYQLFSFVVDLFDDIGHGLSFLMYYPFGGESQMSLGALFNHAHLDGWKGGSVNWLVTFGLAAGLTSGPIMGAALAAAAGAAISLIVGVAVLEFRKLLILLLLITLPLALIAWTFPGQGMQGYWKKWYDNFLKTLLMFPMLILLIAAGRIMAYVAGNTGNGVFLNAFIIIVGFFGPLMVLPKTYKWGGTLMNAAGSAAQKWGNTASKAAAPGIKQWWFDTYTGKRAQDYDEERSRLSIQRGEKKLLFGKGPRRPQFNGTLFRSWQGGRFVPSRRALAKLKKRGSQWSAARAEEEDPRVDAFSRHYTRSGIDAATQKKWDDEMVAAGGERQFGRWNAETGQYDYDDMEAGVGAGKWSLQYMYFKARQRGDSETQKAIIKYHMTHKSLLEFANGRFRLPGKSKGNGQYEWEPFLNDPLVIDQIYKNPDYWNTVSGMRGNFPPNNWQNGGNSFKQIYAKAGFKKYPTKDEKGNLVYKDIDPGTIAAAGTPDPVLHKMFGGMTEADTDGNLRITTPNVETAEPSDRPHLAWKIQDLHEAQERDLGAKGNSAVTTIREINALANGTWFDTHGATPADRAVKEIAQVGINNILEMSTNREGIAALSALRTPALDLEFKKTIETARGLGLTHFVDINGEVHELTNGSDLVRAAEAAMQTRQTLLEKQVKEPGYEAPSASPHLVPAPRGPAPPAGRHDFDAPEPDPDAGAPYMPTTRDRETGYESPTPRDSPRYSPPVTPATAATPAPAASTGRSEGTSTSLHDAAGGTGGGTGTGGVVFDRNQLAATEENTAVMRELRREIQSLKTETRRSQETFRNPPGEARPIRRGPEWPSEGPPPSNPPSSEGKGNV